MKTRRYRILLERVYGKWENGELSEGANTLIVFREICNEKSSRLGESGVKTLAECLCSVTWLKMANNMYRVGGELERKFLKLGFWEFRGSNNELFSLSLYTLFIYFSPSLSFSTGLSR